MTSQDVQELASQLLDENGKLKLREAAWYDSLNFETLRLFCHFYGRYYLPTLEAVEFLKAKTAGKKVIEIGSGCGDLGYHLGIPMTDNYCQTFPDVKAYYALLGQPPITYGPDVLRMDALEAIKEFKPDYVIGAWITQWIDPDLPVPLGGGNIYGIKEELLLKQTGYINMSAKTIHGLKGILKYPHETIELSTLRSRKQDPADNVIWIWDKGLND